MHNFAREHNVAKTKVFEMMSLHQAKNITAVGTQGFSPAVIQVASTVSAAAILALPLFAGKDLDTESMHRVKQVECWMDRWIDAAGADTPPTSQGGSKIHQSHPA